MLFIMKGSLLLVVIVLFEVQTTYTKECQDGESKLSDDNCNTCYCSKTQWVCTKKQCDVKITIMDKHDECIDGETKKSDDNPDDDCYCQKGVWACMKRQFDEHIPIIRNKREATHPVCKDGQTKMDDDNCNTCHCFNGMWGCTEMACIKAPKQ